MAKDLKFLEGMGQPQLAPVVHQVGMSPALIGCSAFCANCWPKQEPAFLIYAGYSLCHKCVTEKRRSYDVNGPDHNQAAFLTQRDPKEVWGEPQEQK